MINVKAPQTQVNADPALPTSVPIVVSEVRTTAGEYTYRLIVVVLGIMLGGIVALFLGLLFNWIPINC